MKVGLYHIVLLIFFTTLLVYLPSFKVPFVFDDLSGIVDNSYLQNLGSLGRIWESNHTRFLANLTFAINLHLSGLRVFDYHLVNFLIHLTSSLAVFFLVRLLSKNLSISAVAALIFALHPIQTQAVTYIVQRMTSMSSMFYIFSLLFYTWSRIKNQPFFYLVSLVSAAFAILTKETGFSLPFAIVLVEFFFLGRSTTLVKRPVYYIVPFFFVALFLFILTRANLTNPASIIYIFSRPPSSLHGSEITRTEYLLTQFNVVATYLRLLIFPINQNLDYDYPITTILDVKTIFSFLIHISLISLSLITYRKNKFISFGILFFYLTLFIESSVFPIEDVIEEHRLYLPIMGFTIAITSIWNEVNKKLNSSVLTTLTILLLILLSFLTFRRNLVWSNSVALWQDTVRKSPQKARPHAALAGAYTIASQFDSAVLEYHKATELDPKRAHSHYNNIGTIYLMQGKLSQAEESFKKAISVDPSDFYAINNLGGVYVEQGKIKEAVLEFQKVLAINPNDLNALKNLGVIYLRLGERDEAISYYRQAVDANPENDKAHSELGEVYRLFGKVDLAIDEFRKARQINPQNTQAKKTLEELTR